MVDMIHNLNKKRKHNDISLNKFIDDRYLLVSYIYRRFNSFGSTGQRVFYLYQPSSHSFSCSLSHSLPFLFFIIVPSLNKGFIVFYNYIINGLRHIQLKFKIDLYSLVCARTDGNTRRQTISSFKDSIFYPVSDNKTKIIISES